MGATLPAVHTIDLIDLVARWGVTPGDLMQGLPQTIESLGVPGARLPLSTIVPLIERARALTGEPALGYYLGLKMRLSAHGFLGFAAMVAPTLREALAIATRFTPTRTDALSLSLDVHGGLAWLTIHEHADFGTARDVVISALLTGIWQIGTGLTGQALTGRAEFAYPEPTYLNRVSHLVPGALRFGQPAHRLIFDAALLDLPLAMADPAAETLARAQCERELELLGFGARILPRVVAALVGPDEQLRGQEAVAKALGISARTLKRRLADERTTFSAVRDTWLRDRATALLLNHDLSVEGVAERLGYSDAANFTRAFVRWVGMTPSAWRRDATPASRELVDGTP